MATPPMSSWWSRAPHQRGRPHQLHRGLRPHAPPPPARQLRRHRQLPPRSRCARAGASVGLRVPINPHPLHDFCDLYLRACSELLHERTHVAFCGVTYWVACMWAAAECLDGSSTIWSPTSDTLPCIWCSTLMLSTMMYTGVTLAR